MPHSRFSSEEIIERGEEIYASEIRDQVEREHTGEFLAVDIETGEYEVDADVLPAVERAQAKHDDAAVYVLRIGFMSAVKLGNTMRRVSVHD